MFVDWLDKDTHGWRTEGVKVNPIVNTLMADTVQLPAGFYHFDIIFTTDPLNAGDFNIQHRNALNNGNIVYQIVRVPMQQTFVIHFQASRWFDINERLRVIAYLNLTGIHQVSIILRRRESFEE